MQGQSAATLFKEQRFGPILVQSLRISKAPTVARFPYYHIDLNAGGGMNNDLPIPVPGSPLNFLRAVEREHRHNFYAFFVDQDLACISELIRQPEVAARADRVSLFHADNGEILPLVTEFVAARERNPQYAMGTILIDPNGYHKGVPWASLQEFCARHPRFDLVINLNVRTFVQERERMRNGPGVWQTKRLQPMSGFAAWFSRPNWMWTAPLQIKGTRWMQFVGRTIQTSSIGYLSLGFYDSRSTRAQEILHAVEEGRPEPAVLFDL